MKSTLTNAEAETAKVSREFEDRKKKVEAK